MKVAWRLSYSFGLPLLQLLLAMLLLLPDTIRASTPLPVGKPAEQLDLEALIEATRNMPIPRYPDRYHAMSFLNIPGMFGEILTSLPTTWPGSWFPRDRLFYDLWTWRMFSWAIYTLPFWWLVGRAIEALVDPWRAAVIRTGQMAVLAITGVLSGILGVGISISQNAAEDDQAMRWLVIPGLMWFGFGILGIFAWRRQRRVRLRTDSPSLEIAA